MSTAYYHFELETHRRFHPEGFVAHEALFQAARTAFGSRHWVNIDTIDGRIVRWHFGDALTCSHLRTGKRTMRWTAKTEAGVLWLMLNAPPQAINFQEGSPCV